MPGSQPVHSVPMPPPSPVHSEPIPPPPQRIDKKDDGSDYSTEIFSAETGNEIHIIGRHDAEVVNDSRIIEKHNAETQCDIQVDDKNEHDIMVEQKLKSIEDTLMLLRTEISSMKRSISKTRISNQMDQPSTNCNQMHCCHQPTPPTYWANPMPPPPPVHSAPMPPPPPVHSAPIPQPPPPLVTTGFGLPPPMMTTGTPAFRNNSQKAVAECSSEVPEPNKKTPVIYDRIPITTEILKSVVLKPSEERIFKKRTDNNDVRSPTIIS